MKNRNEHDTAVTFLKGVFMVMILTLGDPDLIDGLVNFLNSFK